MSALDTSKFARLSDVCSASSIIGSEPFRESGIHPICNRVDLFKQRGALRSVNAWPYVACFER